ncbi:MAG: sulfotransferase family 2 domain-containing protein [Parvibaculaceae bacterium]
MMFFTRIAGQFFRPSPEARVLKRMPLDAINHNFHIMPKLGIVYAAIPKVGCSMLKAAFLRYHGSAETKRLKHIHNVDNQPWEHVKDRGVADMLNRISRGDLKAVAFVRNPYARTLSCYINQFDTSGLEGIPEGFRKRREQLMGDADRVPTFEEFVDAVGRQSTYEMNGHWRPQTEQLLWGDIDYTFVGQLENFDEGRVRLSDLAGHDLKPYFTRFSSHHAGSVSRTGEFYTPEIAEKVRHIYAADFETFGYGTALP